MKRGQTVSNARYWLTPLGWAATDILRQQGDEKDEE